MQIAVHHVPCFTDQYLVELGVSAMGDRLELRWECQASSSHIICMYLYMHWLPALLNAVMLFIGIIM